MGPIQCKPLEPSDEEEDEDGEEEETEYIPREFQRKPEIKIDPNLAAQLDTVGNIGESPPPKTNQPDAWMRRAENVQGRAAIRVPVAKSPNQKITTTDTTVSREETLAKGKILKWGEVITDHCPGYRINDKLANFRQINGTERHCLGLFNTLMRKTGYAYASNKQLAHWLGLKPEGIRPMLRRLERAVYIKNISKRAGVHWWVVRKDLQNSKQPDNDTVPF